MLSGFFVPKRGNENKMHTSMDTETIMMSVDPGADLEREGTAALVNDPRFFTENVIDKRLAAFEAMAIVTAVMSETAMKEVFYCSEQFMFVGEFWFVGVIQVVGFSLMCSVMFMSMTACGVLSLQLFFTIRLMTASPTGFDKASRFYQDRNMWLWRERAINGIKYSLVFYLQSVGCMLFAKFYTIEAPPLEHETVEQKEVEMVRQKVFAIVLLFAFILLAGILFSLVRAHQKVFNACYASLDICHNSLNRHLISHRGV